MAIFLVAYDLRTPGKDYTKLIEALKEYDSNHAQKSLWFVNTDLTSVQIANHLGRLIDDNDWLVVSLTTSNWVALRMPTTAAWLKARGL